MVFNNGEGAGGGEKCHPLPQIIRETAALLTWYRDEGIDTLGLKQSITSHVPNLSPSASASSDFKALRHTLRHKGKVQAGQASNTVALENLKNSQSNSVLNKSNSLPSTSTSIPTPPSSANLSVIPPSESVLSIDGTVQSKIMFLGESWSVDSVDDSNPEGNIKVDPYASSTGELFLKILAAMHLGRKRICLCTFQPIDYAWGIPAAQQRFAQVGTELNQLLLQAPPQIICALGDTAVKVLLGREYLLSHVRGQFHRYRLPGNASPPDIAVMPTHHPATLFENQNKKRDVWSDMKQVMAKAGLYKAGF